MANAIQKQPTTLKQYLEARATNIHDVLPKHLTTERIIKVALTSYTKTPKLRECSAESIFLAVMQAAELGLEPGGALGHAYLVPFAGECVFIPGYRGLIALARRSGEIAKIEAHTVHEGDRFRVVIYPEALEHVPAELTAERGAVLGAYAVATYQDGTRQMEIMRRKEIDKVMAKSKTATREDSPWKQHFEEMARKTVVKRLCKYLPLTPELARAVELDDEADQREAIDITAEPPPAKAKGVEGAKAALQAKTTLQDEPPPEVKLPTMAESRKVAEAKAASGRTMTIEDEPGSSG